MAEPRVYIAASTRYKPVLSKAIISSECDLMIAEVSYPSIGLGMELGWAEVARTPVLCVHQKDMDISSSLHMVLKDFIQYVDANDLSNKIDSFLRSK